MRKIALTLLALTLLAVTFAWPALGSDGVESRDVVVTPESPGTSTATKNAVESPEMLCGETEFATAVIEDILISADVLFPTSTSWNCNGCVEPFTCSSHAECGYPQGVCVQNSCLCICDPDVGL